MGRFSGGETQVEIGESTSSSPRRRTGTQVLDTEIEARLRDLATYGSDDDCPTCRNAELRAFRARIRRL